MDSLVAKMCIAYFTGSNLFIHVGKDLLQGLPSTMVEVKKYFADKNATKYSMGLKFNFKHDQALLWGYFYFENFYLVVIFTQLMSDKNLVWFCNKNLFQSTFKESKNQCNKLFVFVTPYRLFFLLKGGYYKVIQTYTFFWSPRQQWLPS